MEKLRNEIRNSNKAKIKRLVDENYVKTDSSDWSPAPELNADVKTGMRPLRRRAYKKGGKVKMADKKVPGKIAAFRADRIAKKKGGKAGPTIIDSWMNRDQTMANEQRKGIKHEGGMKKGGRAKKAIGGSGNPYIPESAPGQPSMIRNYAGFKKGGRSKKAFGGPMVGQNPALGMKAMPVGMNSAMGMRPAMGARPPGIGMGNPVMNPPIMHDPGPAAGVPRPMFPNPRGMRADGGKTGGTKPPDAPTYTAPSFGAPTDSGGYNFTYPQDFLDEYKAMGGTGSPMSLPAMPAFNYTAPPSYASQAVAPSANITKFNSAMGYKKGGKVKHDDIAEDKKLVKKMVKSEALKRGKFTRGGDPYGENEGYGSVTQDGDDQDYTNKKAKQPTDPYGENEGAGSVTKKRGGSAMHHSDCTCKMCSGGRAERKRGGRTKGKTNIHININTAPKAPAGGMPPLPLGAPPMGINPPPMPAGGPPMGAGAPPMPPGGGMPPMPPGMAGGPSPQAFKRGGSAYQLDAGSGSGEGRLEKIDWYGKRPARASGGKAYKMTAGAESGVGRLQKINWYGKKAKK